jgi:hypothetical protein
VDKTPFSQVVGLNVTNTTVYLSGFAALLVFLGVRLAESWESAVVLQFKDIPFVRADKKRLWDLRDRTYPS